MARRHKSRQGTTQEKAAASAGSTGASHAVAGRLNWRHVIVVLIVAAAAAGIGYWLLRTMSAPPADGKPATSAIVPAISAQHVGRNACVACHAEQDKTWQGSHHQLAMQEATETTVLGNFDNAKFKYFGVESTFFKRDGKFIVRTDGPDGKLADYAVKYTFGVTPAQQYLIEFPGGRYQVLGIAWDARAKEQGGQRWYHLYPNEKIDHKDQLHWTSLYQNWNLQCAACHSSNLKKSYDAASNTYKTTYSEINVSCEACHGPGSRHVEWAQKARAPYGADKGLVALKSRWSEAWKFSGSDARIAQRDQPAGDALMNVCASCHARRSTITESAATGAPLADTHRLALLTAPNYHADGQQRDEVFTWGSFLQSRMYQRGVTCMDCHEPHALKLRAEGNALCSRCHNAAVFDTEKHSFHKAGTKGAQCVECHMPAQNYMVVDPRRDHSLRIPRPDLSAKLGSPNACTQCHADRKPEWAAAAMDGWYGKAWRDRPQYGMTLHAAATQGAKALPSLLALADDPATPSIVKATAVTLAQPNIRPDHLPSVRKLAGNFDPDMRIAALGMAERFEPTVRVQIVAPLLADAVRGVRIEAARVLADVADDQLSSDQRRQREQVTNEYVASLQQDADWPAANVNLGNLRLRQGRPDEAIALFERALTLDPRFAGAYVNLADTYRQSGREIDTEKVLRRGLAQVPRSAELHHALGLLLVRKGASQAALTELAAAVKLAPESGRYAYVYAIGLNSAGKRDAALAVLSAADVRQPYDLDILGALVSINRDAGNARAALPYARKLAEALPRDPGVTKLLTELEASGR
jgi:predicted CXXCH cytochrome family protein